MGKCAFEKLRVKLKKKNFRHDEYYLRTCAGIRLPADLELLRLISEKVIKDVTEYNEVVFQTENLSGARVPTRERAHRRRTIVIR